MPDEKAIAQSDFLRLQVRFSYFVQKAVKYRKKNMQKGG
jgi:hypothetical protein